jgi:hypothetical protein
LGVLVLGIVALNPNGPLLSAFLGCVGKRATLLEEMGLQEQLDQGKDALRRRREAKWQVAEEVIARRRSLAEAIERFRALDRQGPPGRLEAQKIEDFRMSEDEWDYQRVINYVREILGDRPDEADAVIARLEKELQELLADRKKRPAAPVEKPIEPSR